jgi:hypothetical protein
MGGSKLQLLPRCLLRGLCLAVVLYATILFSRTSLEGSPSLLCSVYRGIPTMGIATQSSAQVENVWSHVSTPQHVVMARCVSTQWNSCRTRPCDPAVMFSWELRLQWSEQPSDLSYLTGQVPNFIYLRYALGWAQQFHPFLINWSFTYRLNM